MTEQYSAFRADVPRADDARTQLNLPLLQRLAQALGHAQQLATVVDRTREQRPEDVDRALGRFGQAAPQPLQAAASMAASATGLGMGISLASGTPPVSAEM